MKHHIPGGDDKEASFELSKFVVLTLVCKCASNGQHKCVDGCCQTKSKALFEKTDWGQLVLFVWPEENVIHLLASLSLVSCGSSRYGPWPGKSLLMVSDNYHRE